MKTDRTKDEKQKHRNPPPWFSGKAYARHMGTLRDSGHQMILLKKGGIWYWKENGRRHLPRYFTDAGSYLARFQAWLTLAEEMEQGLEEHMGQMYLKWLKRCLPRERSPNVLRQMGRWRPKHPQLHAEMVKLWAEQLEVAEDPLVRAGIWETLSELNDDQEQMFIWLQNHLPREQEVLVLYCLCSIVPEIDLPRCQTLFKLWETVHLRPSEHNFPLERKKTAWWALVALQHRIEDLGGGVPLFPLVCQLFQSHCQEYVTEMLYVHDWRVRDPAVREAWCREMEPWLALPADTARSRKWIKEVAWKSVFDALSGATAGNGLTALMRLCEQYLPEENDLAVLRTVVQRIENYPEFPEAFWNLWKDKLSHGNPAIRQLAWIALFKLQHKITGKTATELNVPALLVGQIEKESSVEVMQAMAQWEPEHGTWPELVTKAWLERLEKELQSEKEIRKWGLMIKHTGMLRKMNPSDKNYGTDLEQLLHLVGINSDLEEMTVRLIGIVRDRHQGREGVGDMELAAAWRQSPERALRQWGWERLMTLGTNQVAAWLEEQLPQENEMAVLKVMAKLPPPEDPAVRRRILDIWYHCHLASQDDHLKKHRMCIAWEAMIRLDKGEGQILPWLCETLNMTPPGEVIEILSTWQPGGEVGLEQQQQWEQAWEAWLETGAEGVEQEIQKRILELLWGDRPNCRQNTGRPPGWSWAVRKLAMSNTVEEFLFRAGIAERFRDSPWWFEDLMPALQEVVFRSRQGPQNTEDIRSGDLLRVAELAQYELVVRMMHIMETHGTLNLAGAMRYLRCIRIQFSIVGSNQFQGHHDTQSKALQPNALWTDLSQKLREHLLKREKMASPAERIFWKHQPGRKVTSGKEWDLAIKEPTGKYGWDEAWSEMKYEWPRNHNCPSTAITEPSQCPENNWQKGFRPER